MTLERDRTALSHALGCLAGLAVAIAWTLLGCLIAGIQGSARRFIGEWYLLQGFPLITVGAWLLLVIRSGAFEARVANLTDRDEAPLLRNGIFGIAVTGTIGVLGTASLIALGFNARGSVLVFMWITAALVCFTAGYVTAHALEILIVIHRLQNETIKIFHYAPARTPELRSLVSYFGSFALLMTFGYALALAGTLDPNWTGARQYIEAVRLGWPALYVPACTVALLYPHVVIHRLIQREKDQTLLSCQRDIDALLGKYGDLNREEVDRTNSLAQLFDRIAATPDYVLDFGIAVRTFLPITINVISLFAKAATGRS